MDGTPLPPDILWRTEQLFPDLAERAQVLHLFHKRCALNVGRDQLVRSILYLSQGDLSVVEEAYESNFHGDPRDLLMHAWKTRGEPSDWGTALFEGAPCEEKSEDGETPPQTRPKP